MDAHRAISQLIVILIALFIFPLFLYFVYYFFLGSLFYKFDNTALEPQHIFTTIGIWISDTISTTLGELFAEYGAILIVFYSTTS
jgi:hypothetical protein